MIRSWLRRLIPVEVQPPAGLPRRVLAALGWFRLRTRLAARGAAVADAGLYQPLFSPWLGQTDFEKHYAAVRAHTMVSRDRCHVLWRTLQQAARLPGVVVECGVFRGGTALLAARTLYEAGQPDRPLHLFDTFQGMAEGISATESFRPGDFGRTSVEGVRKLLSAHPALHLHPGFIPDSFAGLD